MSNQLKRLFVNTLNFTLTLVLSISHATCKCENITLSGLTELQNDDRFWSKGVEFFIEGEFDHAINCFSLVQSSLLTSGRRWSNQTILCSPEQIGMALLDKSACHARRGELSKALENLLLIANKVPNKQLCSAATKHMAKLKSSSPRTRQTQWFGQPEHENVRNCLRAFFDSFSKVLLSRSHVLFVPSSFIITEIEEDLSIFLQKISSINDSIAKRSKKTIGNIVIIPLKKGEFDKVREIFSDTSSVDLFDFAIKHPLNKSTKIFDLLERAYELQKRNDLRSVISLLDNSVSYMINVKDYLGSHEDILLLTRELLSTLIQCYANNIDTGINGSSLLCMDHISTWSIEIEALLFGQPYINQACKALLRLPAANLSTMTMNYIEELANKDPLKVSTIQMGADIALLSSSYGWGSKAFGHILQACKQSGIDQSIVSITPSMNIMITGGEQNSKLVLDATKEHLSQIISTENPSSRTYSEALFLSLILD